MLQYGQQGSRITDPQPPPRRVGEVSGSVRDVLVASKRSMHVSEIHHAIEQLLGRPVSYRTIKACLSEGARIKQPRFERVSYGCYRLASEPPPGWVDGEPKR